MTTSQFFICSLFILICVSTQALGQNTNDTCVVNPQPTTCTGYQLKPSVIEADITLLCTRNDTWHGMPGMPGCTIHRICQEKKFENNKYCQPFVVYKELCTDMTMIGCSDYDRMCVNGSSVAQCSIETLGLPSTKETRSLITSICNDMPMSGCETLSQSDVDLLTLYSNLCLAMPDMTQCKRWSDMCEPIHDWPICDGLSPHAPPQMRMYFHQSVSDYVLFKGWVPRTPGQYAGTWFAIFIFGILFEGFKFIRHRAEKKWAASLQLATDIQGSGSENTPLLLQVPFKPDVELLRATLQFIEVAWSLLLMLVAMTFNVGLFISVCAGAFFGSLIFGRFAHYEPKASCC